MDTLILSSNTWHFHGGGNLGGSSHTLPSDFFKTPVPIGHRLKSKHFHGYVPWQCGLFVSVNSLHSLSPAQVMISTISIHLLMLISSILLLECPYLAQPSEFNPRVTNPMKFSLTRTTFFFLLLKFLLFTQYQRR